MTQPHRVLTAAEVAAYRKDGYIIVRGLYDAAIMTQWKNDVRALYAKDTTRSAHGVRVWWAHDLPEALREPMADNHVVPILTQIIGPNVEFLSVKLVLKDKGVDFGTPWHQDWYYWYGAEKVSIWIALDNATTQNGCLKVVPGSHRMAFQNREVGGGAGFVNRIDDAQIEGKPVVDAEMKAGDALFFSDRTAHASHPNSAGADRWSFISTYRNAAVQDDSKVWATSMVVAGESINATEKVTA